MKVTGQEILDAIRKNGLPKARTVYYHHDEDRNIVAACAIGQAAINLGVRAASLDYALGMASSRVKELSDFTDLTFPEIADTIEKEEPNFKYMHFYVATVEGRI